VLAVVDPASNRDALVLARRLPLRRLLLDRDEAGFLSFEAEMAKPGAAVEQPPIADDAQASSPIPQARPAGPRARS
jgi:hypothetical protein